MPIIEAEPSPIEINIEQTALIVIDMQKDFLRHGGYGESLGNNPDMLARTIVPIQSILKLARDKGIFVIHTREGHLPDLSDCSPTKLNRWPKGKRIGDLGPMGRILIRGQEGHQIIDEVAPLSSELVLDKPGKNAFYRTDLEKILREKGIINLLITGVTTDVCCSTTVSGANDHGFNAIVLGDCMASYDPSRHKAALEIIKAQGGIFGWVTDSQKVLHALQ
ncbi:MAG: cysteine hydrolase [Patescibacteria group bacterium]